MQFLMLVYTDNTLMEAVHDGQYDTMMRGCFEHADELRAEGKLLVRHDDLFWMNGK